MAAIAVQACMSGAEEAGECPKEIEEEERTEHISRLSSRFASRIMARPVICSDFPQHLKLYIILVQYYIEYRLMMRAG